MSFDINPENLAEMLAHSRIGLWAIECDPDSEPRMYADATMLGLLGVAGQTLSPEQVYHAWYDNIHPAHYSAVQDVIDKMTDGQHAEVQYPWFLHGKQIFVRCGGMRNFDYKPGIRFEGCHRDITDLVHIQHTYTDEMVDAIKARADADKKLSQWHSNIISAISDTYESLYTVDLANDRFIVYKRTEYLNTTYKDTALPFSEAFLAYIMKDVPANDRSLLIPYCSPETIREELKKKNSIDIVFRDTSTGTPRYFEMRCIKPRDYDTNGYVILGFLDRTETISRENEQQQILKRNFEIIEILASEYSSVYYIDLTNDSLTPYTINEETESQLGLFFKSMTYSEAFRTYVNTLIQPEDRPMMLQAGSISNIIRELRNKKTGITTYRSENNGDPHYCQMKFVKVGDVSGIPQAVALGFADKDEILRKEIEQETERKRNTEIIEILASEYTSVYYIDLTTDELDPYTMNEKTESQFGEIFRSGISYSHAFRLYVDNFVYAEDRQNMLRAGSVYNILRELQDKKTFVTRFRSDDPEGIRYCEMKFVKVGDLENPQAVALGFSVIDDVYRAELEAKRREALITGLGDDYEAILFVNLDEQTIEPIRMSEVYLSRNTIFHSKASFEETLSSMLANIIDEDKPAVRKALSAQNITTTFETEKAFYHNYRIRSGKDIIYYQMKVIKTPDWNTDHTLLLGVHSLDDLTRKIITQQKELDAALAKAESANKAKTSFLFNMSHDIRTPMNAIIGFTLMAKKHLGQTRKVADCLNKVTTASNHLLSLINDVLDMSRIESGKITIEEMPVNLVNCFNDLNNMIKNSADEKNITFTTVLDPSIVHHNIYADELRVNRILINLLNNAIKYTNIGGSVSCTVRELSSPKNDYCRLEFIIRDNGIGMSEDFQNHLFEPFSREKSSTVSGITGTGLGMSITRELVHLMGGTISVSSKLGEGTTVSTIIDFRIADEVQLKPDTDGTHQDTSDLTGKYILLAEDNELNQEIACEVLHEFGMEADVADDGTVAVQKFADSLKGGKRYDAILMDVQMPTMDGYKATVAIRHIIADNPGSWLPIIAMTANAYAEDKQKAIESGMDDHIAKPIDIDQFLATLKKHLSQVK